jgi:hypothetical protein
MAEPVLSEKIREMALDNAVTQSPFVIEDLRVCFRNFTLQWDFEVEQLRTVNAEGRRLIGELTEDRRRIATLLQRLQAVVELHEQLYDRFREDIDDNGLGRVRKEKGSRG